MLILYGAVVSVVTIHLMIPPPEVRSQVGNLEAAAAETKVVGEASQALPSKLLYSKAPLRYQKPKRFELLGTELRIGYEPPDACTIVAADQDPVEYVLLFTAPVKASV